MSLDIEGVLAGHVYEIDHRKNSICACGFVPTVNPATMATQQDYHRAHVAAVLREQIAAAQAEALREAAEAIGHRADTALIGPLEDLAYRDAARIVRDRAAQVAPSRVPGEGS